MKKIIAIMWKDLRIRFSGWSEWLFFVILPITFTVVLAGGTGGPGDRDHRIRLVVVDQAQTSLAAAFIDALGTSESVAPDVLPLDKAERELSRRDVSAVLIIPETFDIDHIKSTSVALELRQQPNNMSALVAEQAVNAHVLRISSAVDIAISSVAEAECIRPFASDAERTAYFDEAFQQAQAMIDDAPDRVTMTQGTTVDSIQYDPGANSSAGQLITWVFIPLIGISSLFAYERQIGTLRRLLVSPTRRATYLLGTIFGQVLMALVQMLLLIGFGVIVMKLNWAQSPGALALILVTSALAAAALGTAMGAFVKTAGQANGLSIMVGMIMALLGGCWYPIELFPEFVRTATKVLPTRWAMQGMLNVVVRGQGLQGVLLPSIVLVGFAIVFFAIGVWRFRLE